MNIYIYLYIYIFFIHNSYIYIPHRRLHQQALRYVTILLTTLNGSVKINLGLFMYSIYEYYLVCRIGKQNAGIG